MDAQGRLTAASNVAIAGVPPAAHNVLDSTYHGDVLTGAITRGDILYGNATPKIARLPLGGVTGSALVRDATDVLWSASAAALVGAANSFTLINPLTTIAESWIGPSATAGIYFRSGNAGIGTVPAFKLDVEGAGTGAMVAKIGSVFPFYMSDNFPTLGFNLRYAGNWLFGKGSTSHYGAVLGQNSTSGDFSLRISAAAGAADGVATLTTVFTALSSGNVGYGTTIPTQIISLGGNAARTIWTERGTVANIAGYNLSLKVGGATVGSTDKNGGTLYLAGGLSTGTGTSSVIIQTCPAGSTGAADNTHATMIEVTGNKLSFYGVTAVVRPTALTTALTTITCSAPGTPDYAIADLTQTTPFGFASADEGQSTLKVIANLQTRLGEVETKLQALGLLT